MNTEAMPAMQLVERLLNGIPSIHPASRFADAAAVFDDAVRPLLAALQVPCEFVEVYTADRQTRHAAMCGARIIVFDHAQLEWFALFEQLLASDTPSLVAGLLQRLLAEAARNLQDAALYRFFLLRAGEVAPVARAIQSLPSPQDSARWQIIVLLSHEAAHALPDAHPLRKALEDGARISASMMANEQIAAVSGRLNEFLELNGSGSDLPMAVNEWAVLRDDLNIGDEAIADTFFAVANDPRFLEEIACDAFAINNVGTLLTESITKRAPETHEAQVLTILSIVARTFLHLRLVSYVDEVVASLPEHLKDSKLNPLRFKGLVELGFRGNLVVQRLIDVANDLGGEKLATRFRDVILEELARHTGRLLEPTNQLFELTLLNPQFHREIGSLLAEDGISLEGLAADWMSAFETSDELWRRLVAA